MTKKLGAMDKERKSVIKEYQSVGHTSMHVADN